MSIISYIGRKGYTLLRFVPWYGHVYILGISVLFFNIVVSLLFKQEFVWIGYSWAVGCLLSFIGIKFSHSPELFKLLCGSIKFLIIGFVWLLYSFQIASEQWFSVSIGFLSFGIVGSLIYLLLRY